MHEARLIIAIGLLLCSALLLGMYLRGRRNPLVTRLGSQTVKQRIEQQTDILRSQNTSLPPALQRLVPPVARLGEQLAGTDGDRQQLRRLLVMAGFRAPHSLGLLMIAKYGLGLLLVALVLFGVLDAQQRSSLLGLAGGLVGLFVGTLIPEGWLKWRAARRGGRLSRSLPDGLDLMVICAEAGLPIGRVLQVVSKEMALSAPELADELRYTFAELQILSDRGKALLNLAERCGVSEVETMVATLLQAERYGTPLSQALRTISEESRKTLILNLEEQAGKLPAQMSLPLMLLVLPPIIAMMGAPAMIRLVRMLTTH
ncbi:MAG TPA: type II secretion system F family protein [Pseudomonas sp.]|uniref:type II secretion system F family protein n=1 Tax=Pseudomonas sp. TaxID=306 RepID=UPI002ED7997A